MVQENVDDASLNARLEMVNNIYEGLIGQINERVEQFKEDNPDETDKLNSF